MRAHLEVAWGRRRANEQEISTFKCCILARGRPGGLVPMFQCQVAKPCAKQASTNHQSLEKLYQDQLAQFNTEFPLAALPQSPRNNPMGNNPMGPPRRSGPLTRTLS
ncbi:hypothetical protein LA080_002183 [Diaporthe eres]|nr:hypothetical protein LA080_002183 [Diaporthe eres]